MLSTTKRKNTKIMAKSRRSTQLVADRSRRSIRFLLSNPWRGAWVLVFVLLVGFAGNYAIQYSQAANIEDEAKSKCGAYGIKASVGTARCIAFRVLAPYHGWGSDPGPDLSPLSANDKALDSLYFRESSWRWSATNPSSGAYGIPQSLPPSKMSEANGTPCVHETYWTNATCQMKWGLNYIKNRPGYGNPINAWNHETNFGWY